MRLALLSLLCLLLLACGGDTSGDAPSAEVSLDEAKASITLDELISGIKTLSSDEFEGRAPATVGEEKTINFLKDEFTRVGLQPGNGDSFFHDVPLVESTLNSTDIQLNVSAGSDKHTLQYGPEMIVWSKHLVDQVSLEDSELVFVGYGVVAPEYGWNDYEGLDVKGKTVIILVNDPGYATQDPALFNGNAMTYYGRWTYKYEEAARQGAAGALIIHDTAPASYPWSVVSGSWSGPQLDKVTEDKGMSRPKIEGWISYESAEKIFTSAGQDLKAAYEAAKTKGFKPFAMNGKASIELSMTTREFVTRNVIAIHPGETNPDEYIYYVAHWDHLGKDTSLEGDQIYNGAIDNATGTAGMIEVAEAFVKLPKRQDRTIVFLALTAEESGLLGSLYYADNPVFPTKNTVGVINMDALNIIGKTKDVEVIGMGSSQMEDYLKVAAEAQGRYLTPDPTPEKGFFYRSDHLSFAKKGVPVLYAKGGIDHVEKGKEHGKAVSAEITSRYHLPADEYSDDWDLTGAIQDLKLYFQVGYDLSKAGEWPNWAEGNEFRAARDKDRGGQ